MSKTGNYIAKIPNGKLLKITTTFLDESIEGISIRGDFFAHPEDIIEKIEALLIHKSITEIENIILNATVDVDFFGVSPQDIIFGIRSCYNAI